MCLQKVQSPPCSQPSCKFRYVTTACCLHGQGLFEDGKCHLCPTEPTENKWTCIRHRLFCKHCHHVICKHHAKLAGATLSMREAICIICLVGIHEALSHVITVQSLVPLIASWLVNNCNSDDETLEPLRRPGETETT